MSLAFLFQLFNAQHVSDVNTSILRSLRLICWVISWVVLLLYDVCWCYVVVWLGWCGIRMQAEACIRIPHHLRTDVLTSETCWALNNWNKKASDIKLVSLFVQLQKMFNSLKFARYRNPILQPPSPYPSHFTDSVIPGHRVTCSMHKETYNRVAKRK